MSGVIVGSKLGGPEELERVERYYGGHARVIQAGPRGITAYAIRGRYIGVFDMSSTMPILPEEMHK